MAASTSDTLTRDRLFLTCIGALAGLASWVLVELLPEFVENDRLYLLISVATGGFFSAFLAAIGPLAHQRAALAALLVSGPAALLLWSASFRYDEVSEYIESGLPVVAYGTLLVIGLPFLIAGQRENEGWRNYSALFTQSWNIVVRYAAAWVFVGVVWAVIFLSNALFGLVGLTIIQDILNFELMPYLITGAVLGLALAVVVELSDYISPYLILRLLRLLLPVVLVVTVVFLVALPVQGLNGLFGGLSAAATLMAMAIGIATLITSALDRDDQEATQSLVLQGSARALAVALPVLAGLAVFAIWLRVADYGWTPARLAAIAMALLVLGYGVLYALSVLRGQGWMARIRGANIAMALVAIALGVLWLSPIINPERISARDQLARIMSQDASEAQVDLWFLGKDLGRAGEAAIDELAATDDPALATIREDIARLETARSRFGFLRSLEEKDSPDHITQIKAALEVRPEGRALPEALFTDVEPRTLDAWAASCARKTPMGHPGCILLEVDLLPQMDGPERILALLSASNTVRLEVVMLPNAGAVPANLIYLAGNSRTVSAQVLDQIREGDFSIEPMTLPAMVIGENTLIMRP